MPDTEVIVATMALACVAYLARTLAGSWFSPGPFFATIWTFIVLLSLMAPVFGAPQYPVWDGSIWWMASQVLLLVIGDRVGQILARRRVRPEHAEAILVPGAGLKFPLPILIVCGACTILYMFLLDAISAQTRSDPAMGYQVILGLVFAGPLFAGMVFAAATSPAVKASALLALFPGFVFSLYAAGRTVLVSFFTFWFAGYFSMVLFLQGRPVPLFTKGKMTAAFAVLAIFFVVGILVRPFRGIPAGTAPGDRVNAYLEIMQKDDKLMGSWEQMKPGYFGHVSAFSWYFKEIVWNDGPHIDHGRIGGRTLAGLYRLISLPMIQESVYHTEIGGQDTNVFTIFGPVLMDYQVYGSCMVFLLVGFVAGWAYANVLRGSLPSIAILNIFYTNCMIAGGWYFAYNAVTGSHLIIAAYLFWFQRSQLRKQSVLGLSAVRVEVPMTRSLSPWGRS